MNIKRLLHPWASWVFAIILLVGLGLQINGSWTDSQTTDETNHLASGIAYLRTADFRINPEHPPLTKVLAAIPLLWRSDIKVNTSTQAWAEKDIRGFGRSLLYPKPGDLTGPRMTFFVGRLPMIGWWLVLGILIFWAARRRWGDWPALAAAGLYVFDPNFLGHGHLINTDVPLAAAFFASILALDIYLRAPSRRRLIILSVIVGLTLIVKFSAVLIIPLVIVLGAYRVWFDRSTFTWRRWGIMLFSVAGAPLLIIWACYGFEVRKTSTVVLTESTVIATIDRLHLPIPALSYWNGLLRVKAHNANGHDTALFNQQSLTGWWYYFPVAVAIKTPLMTLGVLFAALGLGLAYMYQQLRLRRFGRTILSPTNMCFIVPPAAFLLIAMLSQLNLGLRHIFPVYPFLFLAAGWAISRIRQTFQPIVVATLLIGAAIVAFLAWPNTISYFNAAAGGTTNGHNILAGSNLDWGQDVYRLRSFLDQQHFPRIRVSLTDGVPASRAYPEAKPMRTDEMVAAGAKLDDVVIISASILFDPREHIQWLRKYSPRWTIGSTIYGYDFRK